MGPDVICSKVYISFNSIYLIHRLFQFYGRWLNYPKNEMKAFVIYIVFLNDRKFVIYFRISNIFTYFTVSLPFSSRDVSIAISNLLQTTTARW